MQHLAGVRARSEDRVIAALVRIPKADALLGIAMHLADEAVGVDDQATVTGSGARSPRASDALVKHAVKLADMPERERAQERPQRRRRRDHMAEHRAGLSRAQHVAVLDAVRPERHRREEAHHLTPGIRRARAITEIDRVIDELLDTEAPRQQRRQHHTSVSDRPLIIENDNGSVRQIMHHAGDLLVQARRRRNRQLSACSGGHFNSTTGQTHRPQRWIKA